MELKFKKLDKRATLPTYGSEGAACFDLYAVVDERCSLMDRAVWPGDCAQIDTGLSFEIPDGWVMKVYSRSGHGFKHGIRLVNGTGIIDADFRGQVIVGLHNDGDAQFVVSHGDRIAQAMLVPVERVSFVEVDELSDTARGTGGLGSTGS